MKYYVFIFLLAQIFSSSDGEHSFLCNQQLMESYDLDGQEETISDKNMMCPNVQHNCCSYSTQINIYKKWVIAEEGSKIQRFYADYSNIFDKLFDTFAKIEQMAKEVQEETASIPGSNCNKIAKVIEKFKVAPLRNMVGEVVRKALKFLYDSRQGFYCVLCNAEDHQFFHLEQEYFAISYKFCSKMVQETLSYYLFKYKFFVKISRLYSEFILKCDLSGVFHKNNFLKNDIKFFKKDKIVGEIESCKKGFNKQGSMISCMGFCERFNPVKYDEYLEGELDKLFTLSGFLERQIERLKQRKLHKVEHEKENQSKVTRRILEEHGVGSNDDGNEISKFNKEFKTALVRPIPYHFKDDLTIRYNVNFDENILKPSPEVIYNLVEFEPYLEEEGIDFFDAGEGASINHTAAERIFELLNPDQKESSGLDLSSDDQHNSH